MKVTLVFLALAVSAPLYAQQDAEGCHDSPLLTRFPGSEIRTCEDKEFNTLELAIAGGATKTVEGAFL